MELIDRDTLLDWLEDERDVCLQHGNYGEASEASYIQKHVMEMPLPKPYREERTEEPMVDKELIENWRNMLKPFISSWLLKTNYEGVGEQDKEEFERDFDEILDLAFIGLKHRAQLLQERTEERTESLCKKVRALCEESKIEFFFVGGGESTWSVTNDKHIKKIVECHKAQLSQEGTTKDATSDTISRQAAIEALESIGSLDTEADKKYARSVLENVPSAQPERTCVNCGRTVNNGGWYADGSTRCPIEEHYALPKDGYCHLWEERNVTDDDYPERRTDGRD